MLTKWAKELVMVRYAATNDKSALPVANYPGVANQKATIAAKKVNGDNIYITPYISSGFNPTFRKESSISVTGVYIGSDSTPATDGDYTLGSIITALNGSISSSYVQDSNGDTLLCLDITLNNPTSEEISINEVGYSVEVPFSTTKGATPATSSSGKTQILVDRTVLGTTMKIAAGDAGVLRYQFKYPVSQE